MKVRLSIIGRDLLAQVRRGVDVLVGAVDSGDMEGVDAATSELLGLTAGCRSVELSEAEWRLFLEGVRRADPEFASGYILPGPVCAPVFSDIAAADQVLELPLDSEEGEAGEPV